jgi:hypothetical protein
VGIGGLVEGDHQFVLGGGLTSERIACHDGHPRRMVICDYRPRRTGAGEQKALHQVHLGFTQEVELRLGLHPLGDHAGAHFAGERGHRADEGAPVPVVVEVPDQLAVQLQEVGGELDDMTQARVAGPGVVDGDPHATRQPRAEVVA